MVLHLPVDLNSPATAHATISTGADVARERSLESTAALGSTAEFKMWIAVESEERSQERCLTKLILAECTQLYCNCWTVTCQPTAMFLCTASTTTRWTVMAIIALASFQPLPVYKTHQLLCHWHFLLLGWFWTVSDSYCPEWFSSYSGVFSLVICNPLRVDYVSVCRGIYLTALCESVLDVLFSSVSEQVPPRAAHLAQCPVAVCCHLATSTVWFPHCCLSIVKVS